VESAANLYEVLGVTKDATEAEILSQYKRLAMVLHPDKNLDNAVAAESFTRVGQAKHHLSEPTRRSNYDASLLGAPLVDQATKFNGKWKATTVLDNAKSSADGAMASAKAAAPKPKNQVAQKKAKWSTGASASASYAALASNPPAPAANCKWSTSMSASSSYAALMSNPPAPAAASSQPSTKKQKVEK